MRHQRKVKHFSRKSGPRKALIRSLVNAIVINGRIKTTVEKAKELRRHVERAITMGKKGTLHARRLLLEKYPSQDVVHKIIAEIAPRFQTRPGGYTRIIKIGRRPGDKAEMAFIEFVDFDYKKASGLEEKSKPAKSKKDTEKKDEKSAVTTKTPKSRRVTEKKTNMKKKNIRKMQSGGRKRSRIKAGE